MKMCSRGSTKVALLIIATLLPGFPHDMFATTFVVPVVPPTKDKQKLSKGYSGAWTTIDAECQPDGQGNISYECGQAAIVEATSECTASAQFFKKDTKVWTWLDFTFIIASAGFTGVGASATLANAKIYSTLGGTTGLGAVTTTINSNASADQAGATLVYQIIASFATFLQTGVLNLPNGASTTTTVGAPTKTGAPTGLPTPAMILSVAPTVGGACLAVGTASSGTGSK